MARAHTHVAVGCLVLGLADVLYLDLALAPSVLDGSRAPVVASADGAGADAEPLLAQQRPSPDRMATTSADPAERAGVRRLDPELSARTGAEPEPEPAPVRGPVEARTLPGPPSAPTGLSEGFDDNDRDVAESEPLPDALPSEPIHIHFARDRATLGPRARARLDRVAAWLTAQPGLSATVDGHTDRTGESMHNDLLSRRRAERVMSYIEAAGVEGSRLSLRAFGERRPFVSGPGIETSRRNRRVEIRVSPARGGGAP